MPEACEIGAERRAAEIVQCRGRCAVGRGDDDGLQRGQNALAIGLPEWNEPAAGRDPVRRQRVKIAMQHQRQRNIVRGADKADRDGIDDRSVALCDSPFQALATPCRARATC